MHAHLNETEQIARHHISERTRDAFRSDRVHDHHPRGRARLARALRRAADQLDG